jgi:hypothetical protein
MIQHQLWIYGHVLKAVENWGMGGKQVRESNGRD